MTLKKDTPRESDFPSPSTQGGTIDVVQGPNTKPSKENAQTTSDHKPHCLDNLLVPVILTLLLLPLLIRDHTLLLHVGSGLYVWANVALHDVDGTEKYDGSEQSIHVLVEGWVAEVVVIACDEGGQGNEEDGEQDTHGILLFVGEGGIKHETGGVDHG